MPSEKNRVSKYPLLEFEYDKKPYEELLKLNPHPEFIDEINIVTEGYEHEDFGLCTGDAQNALGHAVSVLKQLEEVNTPYLPSRTKFQPSHSFSNSILLVVELLRDFKNYCTCVRCGTGDKNTLRDLMEAVLFYGESKAVYDEVMSWNKSANTGQAPYEATVFDFRSLYTQQGDHFLFLNNDLPNALRFYRLAALKWNTIESARSARSPSVKFEERYLAYSAIARGEPCNFKSVLNSTPFFTLYNSITSSRKPLYGKSKLSVSLSTFTSSALSILNSFYSGSLFLPRLALLTAISLIQKYLVVELSNLCGTEERTSKQEQVLRKSKLLSDTPFDALAQYAKLFNRDGNPVTYDSYLLLAKAAYFSNLLLMELDAEEDSQLIAYYTSAEVFSYMLPEKCTDDKKNRLGKLTVMHLSYMNDPNEGQTLRKALYGTQYSTKKSGGRKLLNVPYVFVKCFSPRIDYLPMWEMYGDHAKGCCLVIDWSASKIWEANFDPILYHVCYLRKTDNLYTVHAEDNQALADACPTISAQLEQLSQIAHSLSEFDRRYFDSLLDKVLYLFKDSSYSYEQELRVIYQTKDNILHTEPKNPEDKPWLFVQTPFSLEIDEVILGPKFPDVSTRVPYLQEQIDQMCEHENTCPPHITLSEIDYR